MTPRARAEGVARRVIVLACGVGGAVVAACSLPPASEPIPDDVARRVSRNPPLGPPPADPTNRFADSMAAAQLGHRIFFDTRFSASGTVSCASCHDPRFGFADVFPLARGEGQGARNSMSVLDVAHNRWFTWDGRADTLWSQALQPFTTPHEHGTTKENVVRQVVETDELRTAYERAFGEPPSGGAATDRTFAHIGKALAAYQRKLAAAPSAYDRWWTRRSAGDPRADDELTPEARRGLEIFFGKGNCWECHHGPAFTDGEFHMLGLPAGRPSLSPDPGRYAVVDGVRLDPFNAAGPHSDDPSGATAQISAALVRNPDLWGRFKTPSLRQAARTPPYMHQGQFRTLDEVVRFYSTLEGAVALDHHQELVLRPLGLTEAEQRDLVAFIRCLAGDPPGPPWGVPPAEASAQPSPRRSVGSQP
jgi:cytochrome c peroxidase